MDLSRSPSSNSDGNDRGEPSRSRGSAGRAGRGGRKAGRSGNVAERDRTAQLGFAGLHSRHTSDEVLDIMQLIATGTWRD